MDHMKTKISATKKAYLRKMQSQLDRWEGDIADLKDKANRVVKEYNRQVRTLRSQYGTAQRKLRVLEAASDDAWKEVKGGTDKAWRDMKKAMKKAASKFK
jgi:hypothetical protein